MTSFARSNQSAVTVAEVNLVRWHGSQHPTYQSISQKMQEEGMRPYMCTYGVNARDGVRSNNYAKVLYCVEGVIEVNLPDLGQQIALRPGDRLELPRGIRHGITVGPNGARCLEAAVRGSSAAGRMTTQEVKTLR
ncbi:MAG: hypothetical protein U0528_13250 [Anaerolineae bacterium]|nr:hypothetical protein [Anaerolineae bacterium]